MKSGWYWEITTAHHAALAIQLTGALCSLVCHSPLHALLSPPNCIKVLNPTPMYVCVRGGEWFPPPLSSAPTPTGGPVIQLDSASVYLESVWDHARLPSLPPLRCQFQVQVVTYASESLAVDRRFWWPPPWIWLICCSCSQNLGKHFTS